ncbi:MAG: (d)CMP kinase [Oscillospiraceae bacterium]|jgi:cytidylate kinase|nr:(d)CMP kinase [Oscillospiraceae bacterium]
MISVAIDGPSGAGKSTVARRAAEALGYIYVDTGALYRSIGLFALLAGADCKNEDHLRKILPIIKLELKFVEGEQRVLLNGKDVSEDIRTPEASMAASDVSALPLVREYLLDLQRNMALSNNVIMDGRDIGTVILPEATVKIFLTASAEARAMRRYSELLAKNPSVTYEEVLNDINRRDEQDSGRSIAPLKPAKDAVILDSTMRNLDETVSLVIRTVCEKLSTLKE